MADASDRYQPGLSLCMIVRDEEELLPGCLESARPVCDELIVVDTGSKDRTPQVAERFGARVFHHPWNDSFSEARNHSLRYATREWILILDADERLHPEDHPKLRGSLRSCQADSVLFYVVNELPSGGRGSFYSVRLFRNGRGSHYEGIVHNELIVAGRPEKSDLRVRHLGYALDPAVMRKKFQRSTALLEQQRRESPDDPSPHYHLALQYLSQRRYEEARACAAQAVQLLAPDADETQRKLFLSSLDLQALAHQGLGQWEEASRCLGEALSHQPDFMDALFDLALTRQQQGDLAQAERNYRAYFEARAAWKRSERTDVMMLRSLESAHVAWSNLGVIYRRLGRTQEAVEAFRKAIETEPDFGPAYFNLGNLEASRGRFPEAQELLSRALRLQGERPDLLQSLGTVCLRLGRLEAAEGHYRRLVALAPNEPRGWNKLGKALLCRGARKQAREAFERALQLQPDFEEARHNLTQLGSSQ